MACKPKDSNVGEYIVPFNDATHDREEFKVDKGFGEYAVHIRCKNCKIVLAAAPIRWLTKEEFKSSPLPL